MAARIQRERCILTELQREHWDLAAQQTPATLPPCNSGRRKLRRVYYLDLLGPADNGLCDLTAPYIGRFGPPAPGKKVFILTSQHRNGWRGPDSVVSALVPPPSAGKSQTHPVPSSRPALASAAPEPGSALV